MAVLAPALATAVSFGRMAAEGGGALVAAVLLMLAPAVVGETAFLVGTYASYSQDDTWSPLRSMLVKIGVCLAILAVASTARGGSVLVLTGLAVSVAAVAGAVHRVAALLRGVPPGDERLVPGLARTTLAAAAMVVPLCLGRRLFADVDEQVAALLGAVVVGLVSAAVYLAVQLLLRAPEPTWLLGELKRRWPVRYEKNAEPGP